MEKGTNINWFPGHMFKTRKQIIEDLKLIDIVVEILDARIPISSQNPDIKKITENKAKVIVLNKSDLADETETKRWIGYFNKLGIKAVSVDANAGKGVNDVIRAVKEVYKDRQEKFEARGRIGKSIRIMILGIPNVGKSSFINRLTKKNVANVGNKPGVTRQKQWIRVDNEIELMDTPGILWPKFESNKVAMNLAFTGSIKDDVLERTEIAFELTKFLLDNYFDSIVSRYKLDADNVKQILANEDLAQNDRIVEVIDIIARKRGAILSGGRIDYEKISGIILDEFRSGKLGRISLENAKNS